MIVADIEKIQSAAHMLQRNVDETSFGFRRANFHLIILTSTLYYRLILRPTSKQYVETFNCDYNE